MAFDWKRLTDDGKQHVIDSIKPMLEKQMESMKPQTMQTPGWTATTDHRNCFGASQGPARLRTGIQPGAMKVDLEGNVWIVPRTAIPSANGACATTW
ncbi:MAG: hypothetical protein IPP90_15000 [Gemmatimonadaceae bacterium]|nr:hypothetical protein [Gemmatimonadaceae bacterium]